MLFRSAAVLDPPRSALDWSNVSHYGLVEQYTILKASNTDISSKQWSQPLYREILKCRRRIARAKEEITRCNVEVCRLHTGIRDDAIHFKCVVAKLKEENDPMYEAVKAFAKRRNATHRALLKRIRKIYTLPGFTGNPTPGKRAGHDGSVDMLTTDDDETGGNDIISDNHGDTQEGEEDEEDEDEEAAESDDEVYHEVSSVETLMTTSCD